MTNSIFSANWDQLNNYQIVKLYDQLPEATVPPNADITAALKQLRIANLELLEIRSHSSVYRIKQSDQVFQIFVNTGKTLCFTSHSYKTHKEQDNLLTRFNAKDPVFSIKEKTPEQTLILHHKEPRFTALFKNHQLVSINPEDPSSIQPDILEKIQKKLHAFYSSYIS
jgi:hypothetical protein